MRGIHHSGDKRALDSGVAGLSHAHGFFTEIARVGLGHSLLIPALAGSASHLPLDPPIQVVELCQQLRRDPDPVALAPGDLLNESGFCQLRDRSVNALESSERFVEHILRPDRAKRTGVGHPEHGVTRR